MLLALEMLWADISSLGVALLSSISCGIICRSELVPNLGALRISWVGVAFASYLISGLSVLTFMFVL